MMGDDGTVALLKILSEGSDHLNDRGIICAESGDLIGLSKLIDDGLNVRQCCGLEGYTLLHHACNRKHDLVVNELLRSNVNVNAENDFGDTPLHLAVYGGNMLIVDQLLDHGANVNMTNKEGESCLFYAARKNMPAMIRLLLQRGAQPEILDKYGDRAIDQATERATVKAFDLRHSVQGEVLPYFMLLDIFRYLDLSSVMKASCINSYWHRVSENESIWKQLGVKRWEVALRNTLGCSSAPTSFIYRLPKPKPKEASLSKKKSREDMK